LLRVFALLVLMVFPRPAPGGKMASGQGALWRRCVL